LPAFAILQPDACGDAPFVPVSWYGVDSPFALSGFAGTTMSQLSLAAAGGLPEAPGHGLVDALGEALLGAALGAVLGAVDGAVLAVGAAGALALAAGLTATASAAP
jgi:hypothetical protein